MAHTDEQLHKELLDNVEHRCDTSNKPSTHPLTEHEQEQQQPPQQEQHEIRASTSGKKCHGNRKLQHFKRKCRSRGFTQEQTATMIDKKNHAISEQSPTDPIISEQLDQTNKRKRDILSIENLSTSSIKSMSQLSIASLVVTKKIKHSTATPPSSNSMNTEIDSEANSQNITFYKPSKYLKMPRRLLLHSLHLQLHCSLKKKKEQIFLLSRLQIIDQQFCLEQIRSLYQVYSDRGSSNHVWPVSYEKPLFWIAISVAFILRMIFFESYRPVSPV